MGGSSKKVTVGYKYYIGMHMALCHGPVDKLVRIRIDDRDAWLGDSPGGRLSIDKPSLFGGESREGGVEGQLDFETGNAEQTPNSYLSSHLGSLVPAFRGIAGVVLRQMYIGMNPYLKKWAFRLQRIHTRQDGVPQWQDNLASVGTRVFGERTRLYFAIDVSGSMGGTRLQTLKTAMSDVLDVILPFATGEADLDIRIVAYSTGATTSTRYNCNHDDIESLRSWVNNLSASGNTNYDQAISPALTFFDPNAPRNNLLFFITDGEPTGNSADIAVELAKDMLDLNNDPFSIASGTAVYMHGINIELTDTTQTARLDNTSDGNIPVVSGSDSSGLVSAVLNGMFGSGSYSDMNPAHIIRECLTDPDWGMGYLESDIDEDAFYAAAVTLKGEGFGLSFLWDRQITIEEFIREVLKHIDGVLYVDRKTGLFTLRLIRNDYNIDNAVHLNEYNIDSISDYGRPAFGELTNSVTVNYWNVETGADASVTIQDIALAQMQQAAINTTIQYPGCTSPILAARLAQRDLKTLSSPRVSCTIYANRDAKDLNIGDVFKFSWADYSIENMAMRVANIAYGDGRNNRIRIQCTQDTFDMPTSAIIAPPDTEWVDPQQPPVPMVYQAVFETPYLELVQIIGQSTVDSMLESNPGTGFVGATGARPSMASINARLHTNSGGGYEDAGVIDFCPVCVLDSDVERMDTVFPFRNGQDLDNVRLGSWAQVGNEIVAVIEIGNDFIAVKRGVLDTVPQLHKIGDVILFWDDFSQGDETEYTEGETVDTKLTPVTGSGELSLDSAAQVTVEMSARAFRPYPPAQFRINGQYYPTNDLASILVTWVHRNRVQQTGGELLGFEDGGVTPEQGTRYKIELESVETGAVVYSHEGIDGTSFLVPMDQIPLTLNSVILKLYATRDGYTSYQPQQSVINLFRNFGDNILFEMDKTGVPPAGDNIDFVMGDYLI